MFTIEQLCPPQKVQPLAAGLRRLQQLRPGHRGIGTGLVTRVRRRPDKLTLCPIGVTILLILFDYVFFDAPHREHRRQRQQQYHEDHEVKHASRHGVASLNEANAFWFLHARDDCAVGY